MSIKDAISPPKPHIIDARGIAEKLSKLSSEECLESLEEIKKRLLEIQDVHREKLNNV